MNARLLIGILMFLIAFGTIVLVLYWYTQKKHQDLSEEPEGKGNMIRTRLFEDRKIGEYKTVLNIDNQPFEAIVDTGSPVLLIVSPRDNSNSLGTLTGPEVYRIEFFGSQVTRYQLYNSTLEGRPVTIGVALSSKIDSGTSQNVCGLQRGGFLGSLGDMGNVLLDFPRNEMIIGTTKDLRRYMKNKGSYLETSVRQANKTPSYPLSPVKAVYLNGRLVPEIKEILWDSGSTKSYVSLDTNWNESGTVELVFDTGRVTYLSTTRDQGKKALPVKNCLLIGNIWLSQHAIAFLYQEGLVLIEQ